MHRWLSLGNTSNQGLISYLKTTGVLKSQRVIDAMLETDRGHFTNSYPYEDTPQSIGYGATISAPHMHAYALELLEPRLKEGCRALDVGSGTGYVSVVMARMVGVLKGKGSVVGVELIKPLVNDAKQYVQADCPVLLENPNYELIEGNAWDGLGEDRGPFDAIHVGAAAEQVPPKLLDQLAPSGIMVIPVGPAYGVQRVLKIVKDSEGEVVERTPLFDVAFVPLVKPGTSAARWGSL